MISNHTMNERRTRIADANAAKLDRQTNAVVDMLIEQGWATLYENTRGGRRTDLEALVRRAIRDQEWRP